MQGQTARGGMRRHAGNGIEPLGAVVNDLRDAAGLQKPAAADRHGHGEHVVRVEPGIDRLQVHKCANEQRRSDDQNERQSHFANDQKRTHLAAAEAYTGAVAALVQGCCKIFAARR